MPVLFLFLCSGATALVYEVLWSKYLSLMFGSTIQAQTVVLAVFMGGLALGNRLFGGRADRTSQPLAWYGYMELTIGLYAFFFPQIYGAADQLFAVAGARWFGRSALLLWLKGFLAVALLALPTVLMGGTLPVLVAWLKKRQSDSGRLSALFYSINSVGAVLGSAVAGFLLVRQLGMSASLQATALLNVGIGLIAVAYSRKTGALSEVASGNAEHPAAAALPIERSACLIVTLSGAVSMGLEVLASRCLSLIFGGSLQSFAIVLMAFILGIGIGSALVASRKFGRRYTPASVITFLLGAAAMITFFVITIEPWTIFYSQARSGLAQSPVGYVYNELLIAAISLVVLGIPAGLLGSVLPLWIKILSDASATAGRPVGKLLTWNTLGGVAGVLITGFILMPRLGLRGSIGLLAFILGGSACYLAATQHRPRFLTGGMLLLVVLSASLLWGGEGWRHVLGSGVFRLRTEVTAEVMEQRRKFVKILFYEDAPDATVSVETTTKKTAAPEYVLRINGKPDASTFGDLSTQYLLAHLPILAKPSSKDVFVLGFGSGITAGALLGHPLNRVTVAENCAPILRAGRLFDPWNRGVLTNQMVRVFREDARTVLKLSPEPYDVIISEPSNPWVAGIGSVFSREFYELCASRLKPGGVMAQWFHIYEMHDGIVSLVLRTFGTVFPHMEVWDSENGDIIMLGSLTAWESSPETYKKVFERPIPRQDLEAIGLKTPESVWARQIASQKTAHEIAGQGAIQSDEFPVLEYEAPRAFFIGRIATDLFIYDERTLQSALAPPAKRALLQKMPDASLHPVFAQYSSGNGQLVDYLKWRAANPSTPERPAIYTAAPFFPIVFRGPETYPREPSVPAKSSAVLQTLVQCEAGLYHHPQDWEPLVKVMRELLENAAKNPGVELDWTPAYYAGLAARELLAHDRKQAAAQLAALGLSMDPNDPQLNYLARVAASPNF